VGVWVWVRRRDCHLKVRGKQKVMFRSKGNGRGNVNSKVAGNIEYSIGEGKLTVSKT
jgi:hypothetical protein